MIKGLERLYHIMSWNQGYFIDSHRYDNWSKEDKDKADFDEHYLVRPHPTENAICRASSPEKAAWIAERLNLATRLEYKMKKILNEIEKE